MSVSIHGKEYATVAERVGKFREDHADWTIATEIIDINEKTVVVKASILNAEVRVISTGFAEEVRTSSNINKTSALENCETSAVGRALAFFGMAGTDIASADEVINAIKQQSQHDNYGKQTADLKSCDTIEVLMDTWRNVWQGLGNDQAGKEILTPIYNDCKARLS